MTESAERKHDFLESRVCDSRSKTARISRMERNTDVIFARLNREERKRSVDMKYANSKVRDFWHVFS